MKKETSGFGFMIRSFMTKELGLRNSTVFVYAALYSFTCSEAGMYYGSRRYLAESLHISARTLTRSLNLLFGRGLIEYKTSDDGALRGIRCTYINDEGDGCDKRETSSGAVPAFWTEERKNIAYENLIRKKYGDISGPELIRRREAMKKEVELQGRLRRHAENEQRIMRETYFQRHPGGEDE